MVNNNGTGLLRNHKLKGISSVHNTVAKGWVESTGFEYIDAKSKEDFDSKLRYFVDSTIDNFATSYHSTTLALPCLVAFFNVGIGNWYIAYFF